MHGNVIIAGNLKMLLPLLASSVLSQATVFQRLPDRVIVPYHDLKIQIQPLAERSVRIRVSRRNAPESKSFAIIPSKAPVAFSVRSQGPVVEVRSRGLRVRLDLTTGALKFQDAHGATFLSEIAGTRVLSPVQIQGQPSYTVGQSFYCPPDEKLYGLGQFQDGIWNWRGMPMELRQLNTQIAFPVLVSNKGYGLLWDNASRTDFNPPDISVPLQETSPAAPQARGPGRAAPIGVREGTLLPPADGTYGICTRDGDRRNEISILVDGKPLNRLINTWTPRGLSGKVDLKANVPVRLEVRGGGKDVKLFARRIDDTTTFRSDFGDGIDYTVFYGPKLGDVVSAYRSATGEAPMWPKWAFGFWQCRERYASQAQLLTTAAELRSRHIPVDLIIQDWLYWGSHGWGSYEWDQTAYPDPAGMIAELHRENLKFMISVWCNPNGETKSELEPLGLMPHGWIDVFSDRARQIRWKHIEESFFSKGTDAWWGDATEPGDPGTELLGAETAAGPADEVTSAYPLFASKSLYDGQRRDTGDKRVVILTRSAFPGMQRYGAAVWSGDIAGSWDALRRQIPAGLNVSLAGLPYWTTDTGGFFRPRDQYKSSDYNELLTRWFEWSTFVPILRVHGYQSQTEMWNYLPETYRTLLAYDKLRYSLLPYTYSVAWHVSSDGETFMRPLCMDFPKDPQSWEAPDEYLFGPAILVAPVTAPGAVERPVYLPRTEGGWINFWTGERETGGRSIDAPAPLNRIPLFLRAGAIVPVGPDVEYASQIENPPTELRVYSGANGSFELYDDAGDGYGYEKGQYATIPLRWNDATSTLVIGKRRGSYPGMPASRHFRVRLMPADISVDVDYNGAPKNVQLPSAHP